MCDRPPTGLKMPLVEKGPVPRRATPAANGIGVASPALAGNRTGRFSASGSRTRPHAFVHGTSCPKGAVRALGLVHQFHVRTRFRARPPAPHHLGRAVPASATRRDGAT